jgi:hypothetical protein
MFAIVTCAVSLRVVERYRMVFMDLIWRLRFDLGSTEDICRGGRMDRRNNTYDSLYTYRRKHKCSAEEATAWSAGPLPSAILSDILPHPSHLHGRKPKAHLVVLQSLLPFELSIFPVWIADRICLRSSSFGVCGYIMKARSQGGNEALSAFGGATHVI